MEQLKYNSYNLIDSKGEWTKELVESSLEVTLSKDDNVKGTL